MSEARRAARWDRPAPPHDWRWVVGTLGKVLIATGLLMFAFVAYQLWGTGLEYAQAQNRLDDEFDQLVATSPPSSTSTSTSEPITGAPTTDVTSLPPASVPATTASPPVADVPDFSDGDVMARIEIPSIGLDAKVVSGVQTNDLKDGPGHYPDTPMPGQLGNSAIAGHRTTYGQPFYRLDELAPGDEIVLTTVQGRFVYRMTGSEIVGAERSDVIATTDPTVARLTLTTCHPRYTAAKRLVVYADLDLEASAAPQAPIIDTEPEPTATLPGGPATTVSDSTVAATTSATAATTPVPESGNGATTVPDTPAQSAEQGIVDDASTDAFSHGWFSDDGAWGQVILWGLALSALGIGAYLLSRQVRRNWVGALAGIVPFVIVLYFFFQNVNRLLPAAL
ncbi:MAG: class E sortase [Ilumatobacteraceae bacterium]